MPTLEEGDLLWEPTDDVRNSANLTRYMGWLAMEKGLRFDDYSALWRWSVTEIGPFWQSLWDYFGVIASEPATTPLAVDAMPGAQWFPGARLNYAENVLARLRTDGPVIWYQAEDAPLVTYDKAWLVVQTQALAAALRDLGVQKGDRVVAYLPNIPEAIAALLAVTSLGAIWSSCPPDFGRQSVLDRFSQIEPKILLAVDGYRYGGKQFDRRGVLAELQAALPSLERTILLPHSEAPASAPDILLWNQALQMAPDRPLSFEQVPFDHPLWILYSSGTTGLPKPIVHGHGGILLEHLKALTFHNDIGPGDRFFWYSSTGWMMWNYVVGALLTGAGIILYNGSPGYPDLDALWALAEQTGMTYFGTAAAYISACLKAGLRPSAHHDLSRLRALGSTGSPLTVDGFQWVYEHVNPDLALESLSGGTDLCTAFVGGARTLPIYAGEIQGASLGANVQAYDDAGRPVVDEVGELVITRPMPSMPVSFWNDQGNGRYQSSYFEMYPGVWRHGDWIKINERGGCVIYGRSDATINRQGVRMGTAEMYQAIEALPEIADTLVVDLELLGRESYMPLFVVLGDGATLDDALKQRIRHALRTQVSPRHIPDDILPIPAVPYTLSGKKMEIPVRRILLGHPLSEAVNRGAMRNPDALKPFIEMAKDL